MSDQEGRQVQARPPLYGLVYGEIVYWMALVGMIVAVIGSVLSATGTAPLADSQVLLDRLLTGARAQEIWLDAAGSTVEGHWYIEHLFTADGISMLGVAICSAASIVGIWISLPVMFRGNGRRERTLYVVLMSIVAVILTASIMGIF